MGLTANALAIALMIPAPRINDIVWERRGITADTALRLAKYFGTSVEFWLGLQADYEAAVARANIAGEFKVNQAISSRSMNALKSLTK